MAELRQFPTSLNYVRFALILAALVIPMRTYAAEIWTVDMANSRLGFIATQASAEFEGRFHKFNAKIEFSPDDLEHSLVDVEIDMLSVDTQSGDRDGQIGTSDWFNSSVFPTARFLTKRFVPSGNGQYEAHARLTIRDIGHDVVMPFTLKIENDPAAPGAKQATVTGRLDILRTAWGIGQGQWADTGTVGDKVIVTVDLVATADE